MEISLLLSVASLAVTAALTALFLRESRMKTAALLLMIACGIIILLRLLPYIGGLTETLLGLADSSGVQGEQLAMMLKIVALAYIAEFGAQLCRDAGEGSAALKIELAARVAILLLALPLLSEVVQAVLELLA